MLDVRLLRDDPDVVRRDLEKRGRDVAIVDEVRDLDQTWRQAQQDLNDLRAKRNSAGKAIAEAKKAGGDVEAVKAEMKTVSDEIRRNEDLVESSQTERDRILRSLPNIMHESVPKGADDTENEEIARWGEHATSEGVSHVDLLDAHGWADLEKAAEVSGARFYYLKGDLVLLAKAIETLALHHLVGKGYLPIQPPYMMRREAVEGAVDLADFEDVIYKIENEDLYLIATSEHPLTAMHKDEILPTSALPLKYAGTSSCYRKEAGSHGKDTKGIFRVHQFDKVEQVVFSTPEESWDLHEEMRQNAEEILQKLELPYRVVNICTGDLGTVASKKYDLEAWMPTQGKHRELVSCSNCTDYQARRYKIRHRTAPGEPTELVHTLNSTAIAVQRALVAILENHQDSEGRVRVPAALQPLMLGRTHLEPIQAIREKGA